MTKVTSRLHQNVVSNVFGTKLVWRGNCAHFHLYAVFRTHPGPKPTWWHTPSRSSAGIYTTMQINFGRIPSTRIHVGRVNKQVCNHGVLDNPFQSGAQTNNSSLFIWSSRTDNTKHPCRTILSGQILSKPNSCDIPIRHQSSSGFKRVFSTPLSCRTRPTRHSISSP